MVTCCIRHSYFQFIYINIYLNEIIWLRWMIHFNSRAIQTRTTIVGYNGCNPFRSRKLIRNYHKRFITQMFFNPLNKNSCRQFLICKDVLFVYVTVIFQVKVIIPFKNWVVHFIFCNSHICMFLFKAWNVVYRSINLFILHFRTEWRDYDNALAIKVLSIPLHPWIVN